MKRVLFSFWQMMNKLLALDTAKLSVKITPENAYEVYTKKMIIISHKALTVQC